MGAGISQEQLEAHITRQEMLLKQLQAVVDRQTQQLRSQGDADTYDHATEKVAADTGAGTLKDEINGLARAAKAAEKKKEDIPVDAAETAKPSIQWKEPTEEEERHFMATKPWLGAMAQPDGFQFGKTDGNPDVKLELEHVYGYRARTCRNNIAWVDGETIVYPAAGVGVIHNMKTRRQLYCRDHTDDIVCLAYHAGRKIVATGEQGKSPAVIVWDATNGKTLAILKGFHKRAVVSVAFSADGSKVASVGLDDDHSIAIYDWCAGALLATSKGDTNRILDIQNNTTRDANAQTDFVTVGVKHIKFWSLQPNGTLNQERGLLGTKGEQKSLLTVGFTTLYSCVGTSDGEFYLFEGNKLTKVVDAHQKHVYAIKGVGDTLYSGGKDGYVSLWNMNNQKKLATVNLNKYEAAEVMSTSTNAIRAIDISPKDGLLLVGTITSSIYTVNVKDQTANKLLSGHFGDLTGEEEAGELWGCAASPKEHILATAGEDSTLRIWDTADRVEKARLQLKGRAISVAWNKAGTELAVGLNNGTVQIVSYNRGELDEVSSIKKRSKRIQCVAYSPCGQYLASGSAENLVDIYDAKAGYKLLGSCKGNNSVILHLDFSADSKYLQTCSQSYELLFYEVANQTQFVKSRDLRNQAWDTFTSILGWTVQGIWPAESDGSDVNAVAKSGSERYLASAEDTGLVKLFNYPCVGGGLDKAGKLVRRPQSNNNRGHSSHVTNVVWDKDDSYVFSTGGADLCVFQWKVVQA